MISVDKHLYMTKKLLLRAVPLDVYRIILQEQAEQKVNCNCQFSIEKTIYKLIRKAKEDKTNQYGKKI